MRGAGGAGRARRRRRGGDRGAGGGAGRAGARAVVADGDGGVPRRVRALDRRGRRADVPRGGAAPGAGRGDHRRADRRQDRAVELGGASRAVDLEPGQRGDLGAADHRAGARRRSGAAGGGAARDDPAARRAGGADRGRAGDEADGARSSCSARPSARRWTGRGRWRGRGTPTPTTCSARRRAPTADALRYAAAYAQAIAAIGGAGDRRRGGEPGDLGEALGAASALRVDAPRAR